MKSDREVHPVVKLSRRFREVFRGVPGRKAGIKAALRSLFASKSTPGDVEVALEYAAWALKRPGSIANPVGWFKACVMRRFWETDDEYQSWKQRLHERDQGEDILPWKKDTKKLSPEEMREGIDSVFREAGLARRGKNDACE